MSLDDVMFGMIVGGLVLCVAYFRAGYIAWREHRAAERRNETRMRKLHFDRLSRHEEGHRSVDGLLTRGD
jgi:hypothetical protein